MTDLLTDRLAALDACAVSDALDRLGISGVPHGLSRLSGAHRVAGRAVTVRLAPAGAGAPATRHLGTAAVEASGAGDVIVVEHAGRRDVAGWGGLLSLAAVQRGVAGVVVDGAVRDLDESRDLGLAVYGVCATPVTARGRVVEDAWDIPVTIAGIAVDPGDYVVADGSGLAFVPRAAAQQVVTLAQAIVRREWAMAEQVREGVAVSEVMGANYESMLQEPTR